MINAIIQILYVAYVVVGAYCAGMTASDDLKKASDESLIRVLSWIFGWPFKVYKDMREDNRKWKL